MDALIVEVGGGHLVVGMAVGGVSVSSGTGSPM